jgi:hypothetical protein
LASNTVRESKSRLSQRYDGCFVGTTPLAKIADKTRLFHSEHIAISEEMALYACENAAWKAILDNYPARLVEHFISRSALNFRGITHL